MAYVGFIQGQFIYSCSSKSLTRLTVIHFGIITSESLDCIWTRSPDWVPVSGWSRSSLNTNFRLRSTWSSPKPHQTSFSSQILFQTRTWTRITTEITTSAGFADACVQGKVYFDWIIILIFWIVIPQTVFWTPACRGSWNILALIDRHIQNTLAILKLSRLKPQKKIDLPWYI